MARFLPAIAAFAGISLTGLALYPVLARDLDGFEFTDPLDLVLPPEPAAAVEAAEPLVAEPSLEEPVESVTAIAEPEPPAPPEPPKPVAPLVISTHSGEASWYGPGLYGNRTANGEVFRPGTMTAAHRTLPFGTRVRVTNLWNGRKAVVRINDRGPFAGDRVIDLAHGAASELGLTSSGIAQVRLEVLR
jgi:rare lipoprotein A|tara:strand:+ start:1515 stop:2081 length:567 start_codon:yes stop_codon:yes gene_type:complete